MAEVVKIFENIDGNGTFKHMSLFKQRVNEKCAVMKFFYGKPASNRTNCRREMEREKEVPSLPYGAISQMGLAQRNVRLVF